MVQGALEHVLVAGTLDGSLVALDTSRMGIVWNRSLVSGAISSMSYVRNSDTLVVMTRSGKAFVLDLRSGKELAQWACPGKLQDLRMASLPGGQVLLAGSTITLVDGTTGAATGKWIGHATPIIGLATEDNYFCTVAAGDRTLGIWSTRLKSSGKIMQKSAVGQITLNHPISLVSTCKISDSAFHVVAVTISGSIHIFKCTIAETKIASTGHVSIESYEWARSDSSGLPVVQLSIDSAHENSLHLSIVYGTVVKPKFSTLTISIPPDGSIAQILKPNAETEALMKYSDEHPGKDRNPMKVPSTVAVESTKGFVKGIMDIEMGDDGVDASSDGEDIEYNEEKNMTFAQRIAGLVGTNEPAAVETASPRGQQPPKFDSLAILLSQAIANEDNNLLERCLSVSNMKTISETARHLSPQDAVTLLTMLVHKIRAAPRRGTMLVMWIKAVLMHHIGYLTGTGVCKDSLSSLYQLIDSRLASYPSMVSLNSRLGLVLSNASNNSRHEHTGHIVPLVTAYFDEDGTIEVQDAAAATVLASDSESGSSEDETSMDEYDME